MKFLPLVAASAVLLFVQISAASAHVEIGEPEFPNFLSPPYVRGTCYWWNSAWFWACPTPEPVAAAVVAPAPTVKMPKKAK